MGWTFCKKTLPQLVAEHSKTALKHKLVTHSLACGEVNSILWCIHEYKGQKYISCMLYQVEGREWGYNSYSESSYPYYFSCPLEYLEECPVTSQEWRDGVKEYWKCRQKA